MAKTVCQSCKDERIKRGLKPVERLMLPLGVTDTPTFWRPKLPVYVCSNCDGEALIASALRSFQQREAA